MTMNPWDTLGVAPTTDVRAILRAYAEKLRITRPEDDPIAFQRLVEAREFALSWRPAPVEDDDVANADDDVAPPEAERDATEHEPSLESSARQPPLRWRAPASTPSPPDRLDKAPRDGARPRRRRSGPSETKRPRPQSAQDDRRRWPPGDVQHAAR